MKQGLTIQELAAEVQRRSEAKRDFKADSRRLSIATAPPNGGLPPTHMTIDIGDTVESFEVNDLCHGQIAERLGVPKKFYDRLRADHPSLLDRNVNHLLAHEPGTRLIRTLDARARAFLSDRYRCLDNDDLLEAVMPILMEAPELSVVSSQITDKRLYLKAVFPRTTAEVKVGDVVQGGVIISNSEVGDGAISVFPTSYRLWCDNGCTHEEFGERRAHLGRASGEEGAIEVYRDETLAADDKAFWMKLQDTVRAAMNETVFEQIVEQMREATDDRPPLPPQETVEVVARKFDLNDTEKGSVLTHLIEGGDLSRYGLLNAVTRASQDVESYDRATELEAAGGRLLSMRAAELVG